MSETSHSLIRGNGNQLSLINSTDIDDGVFSAEEKEGHFTGERLIVRDPERYRCIVALISEGFSVRRISGLLHVSPNTVVAVRSRESNAIDALKTRLGSDCYTAAQLCVEGIIESLLDPALAAKISARDKAIILGVLTDKAQLLTGGATSRIETLDGQADHDAYNAMLLAAGMGQRPEKDGQKDDDGPEPIDVEVEVHD